MVVIIKKKDTQKNIRKKLKSMKPPGIKKKLNAYKYLGVIKINGNPDEIQKKLRNEWD
jgi:hypothetical protein